MSEPDSRTDRRGAIRAVLFDLGGVVVRSPIEGITQYEREHGVPEGFVNASISGHGGGAGGCRRHSDRKG